MIGLENSREACLVPLFPDLARKRDKRKRLRIELYFSPHRASHTKLFLSSKQHLRRFYLANTFFPAAVLLRSKVFHDSRRMILFSSETEIETLLFTKLETKGWTAWFLDCTELVQPIINSARKGYRERHPWKRS